ncbi:MAG: glucose-6-phosphate isomerase [Spirochaetales bacterium]|nr:glucose-6-phosphate isomerase [Spirochaetales bacterium]
MNHPFYVETPIKFDENTGLGNCEKPALERRYSNMKNMYLDEEARAGKEAAGDDLIYNFYELGVPEKEGELAYGTSIVYPGKVGNEYHMTNGHFHTILDTAEIYYCQAGHGVMMMESPEGDVLYKEMKKGEAVYVPGRYAHRSINVSETETLITFYVFRADAGHDYGSIKEKGFRKLVVEEEGSWKVIDNPRWNG